MNDYIARYRAKYPDDNNIPDEVLVELLCYQTFAFNTAVRDCAQSIVNALKPEIDKLAKIFK